MLFPLTTAAWVQRWDPPILEWWSCLRSFYNSCTLQPSKYWNLLSSMLSSLWSSSGMHVCSGPSLHTIKFVSLVGSLPHQDHHYHPSYSPYHTLLHPVCDVVLDGRVNLESQGMELPLDMLPLSVDVLPLKHIGPHQPLSQQQWGMRRYAHPSLTVHNFNLPFWWVFNMLCMRSVSRTPNINPQHYSWLSACQHDDTHEEAIGKSKQVFSFRRSP